VTLTPEPSEEIRMTPPPAAARALPMPPVARRPTLVGVPPSAPPRRVTGPVPTLPPPGPPAGRPGALRRSGLNLPAASAVAPQQTAPQPRIPTPMNVPPPPRFREPQVAPAPFGTGSFETVAARRPARRGVYGLLAIGVVAAGVMVYVYNNSVKPGRIELTTTPADATVVIDNVKVGDHSPVSIEKPAGPYTLSVTRDGYARSDQNIELKAGQPLALTVTLEPSPDTGFELTSDPPGGLVWLDGAPVKETSGQQARTNFRASRISPGHHVLEIRSDRFKAWQQDVEIEPGGIRKVHATLVPAVGGAAGAAVAGSGNSGGGKPAPLGASSGSAPSGHELTASSSGNTPGTPPTGIPTAAGTSSSSSHRPSGGGSSGGAATGAASGPVASAGGGVVASPGAGAGTGKRRRPRGETQGDDSGGGGGGDPFADDAAPAPRKTQPVATDDAPAGGGDCSITINSIPWSEVWIDGKNTTKHTPFVDYKLPCGKHKIAFKRPDMQIDQTESITVKPGQNFKQRYTLATGDD
jgi:hypothetical protein